MTGPAIGPRRAAVIGAGLAGAAAARALADQGWQVTVFDKSRGVGGRMATRRAELAGPAPAPLQFDHGAPFFTARAPAFAALCEAAARQGVLHCWVPRVAASGHAALGPEPLWVPAPDAPALARHLLDGAEVPIERCVGRPVAALVRGEASPTWQVRLASDDAANAVADALTDEPVAHGFDAVIVAVPPAQSAPLLAPWRSDWAAAAGRVAMRPGWTLMAVVDGPGSAPPWDLAYPARAALSVLVRDDAKPGRRPPARGTAWVAHAQADWSRLHLDDSPERVCAVLQAAVAGQLEAPVQWLHAVVHRWRYASASRAEAPPAQPCWWDAGLALGLAGDHLGGAGVEGAWVSGRALGLRVAREPGGGAHAPPGRDGT